MPDRLVSDLKNLKTLFIEYYSEIIIVSSATLFMILNRYHTIENPWISSFVYFAVLPIAVILIPLRKSPFDFGLRLGNIKLWLAYTVIFLAIALPVIYFASDASSVRSYYLESDI